MKAIHKVFLRIQTEASQQIILSDGTKLYFDDKYEQNAHRQQIGQIAYIPEKYSTKDNEVPMSKGDIVYFHHNATQDSYKILIEKEILYHQDIEQIFAVKRGNDIICRRDFTGNEVCFVEQESESEENVITKSGIWLKEKAEELKQHGTIIALPPNSKEWSFLGEDIKFNHKIKIGSRIVFKKKSEYQINADFGKRKVYKMPLENILMILK